MVTNKCALSRTMILLSSPCLYSLLFNSFSLEWQNYKFMWPDNSIIICVNNVNIKSLLLQKQKQKMYELVICRYICNKSKQKFKLMIIILIII